MQLFGRDLDREVLVVAEIGVNHEGSEAKARLLIELAAGAGAHAVKLQSYTPWRYASANDPARLERVGRFSLDEAAHRRLAEHARTVGIPLFSTALTEDYVPLLAELFPVIKIASGDLNFEPVVRAAARSGRPVILSTGASTEAEIRTSVGWFEDEVGSSALRDRLLLMHCVAAYPVPPEQANLLAIPALAAATGLRIGYSNHVLGSDAAHAAIILGACAIEVHITDSRDNRTFRDHELSLLPDELKALVLDAPRWRSMRGVEKKFVMPAEAETANIIRKGLVAGRDLAEGTVLTDDDLAYARPATQIPASGRNSVIGRRLTRALTRGSLLEQDMLA
jgi:N-acetylneuraminate synthase/N,N'-diacetyllegionaminate synthase